VYKFLCLRSLLSPQSIFTSGQIPVSVFVVPRLAVPVRTSTRACLSQLPYLSGLTLAHPVTSDTFLCLFKITLYVVMVPLPSSLLLSRPLPVRHLIEATSFHVSALSCIMEEAEPHTLWQVQSVGTTLHAEHNFLQEYMAKKISVRPDGAYSLKFPWKTAHPPLPSNYCVYTRRT